MNKSSIFTGIDAIATSAVDAQSGKGLGDSLRDMSTQGKVILGVTGVAVAGASFALGYYLIGRKADDAVAAAVPAVPVAPVPVAAAAPAASAQQ